jgi:polar amino acid transport system permease protein
VTYTFEFHSVTPYWPLLLEGLLHTLWMSVVTMAFGLLIGIAGAFARTSGNAIARSIATSYVEVIRNTPLLIQLFIVFFGLPSIGVRLDSWEAAIVGLSINVGAYLTEIIRAGIESVRRSQVEAGLALGLTPTQIFRYVIFFQAVKATYPALTSQFILLMLVTSVTSQIGADELFHAGAFVDSRIFRSFEVFTVTTLVYLVLALAFRLVFSGFYAVVFGGVLRSSR